MAQLIYYVIILVLKPTQFDGQTKLIFFFLFQIIYSNQNLVLSAKGILTKGKNGTNNCFVTIALGKEKFQTSVKEKAEQNVDWREECELYVSKTVTIIKYSRSISFQILTSTHNGVAVS